MKMNKRHLMTQCLLTNTLNQKVLGKPKCEEKIRVGVNRKVKE